MYGGSSVCWIYSRLYYPLPILYPPHLLLLDCDKSGQHRTDKCFSLLELVKDDGGSCDAFIGEYACSPHGFEQRTLARFVHMV